MTTNDTPQPDAPDNRFSFLKALEDCENEIVADFGMPGHLPSMAQPSPNEPSHPRRQLWVIVGSEESGWLLEEVDGRYVDIGLAEVQFVDSEDAVIEPQAHLYTILDENRGRFSPDLISVENTLLVGRCVPQSREAAEHRRICLHVKVNGLVVRRLTQNITQNVARRITRYVFEASAPIDSPQPSQEWGYEPSWMTEARLRDHQRSSDVTQEWEIHSSPSGSSYALARVDDRSIRKSLESFELQESGCSAKVVIKILIEMNALSPMPLRGLVGCDGFEIAGVVTNVERGRWHDQAMVTIEAWLCGSASRGDRSFTFTVRPFQSDISSHVIPPAMGSSRRIAQVYSSDSRPIGSWIEIQDSGLVTRYAFGWRGISHSDASSRASAEGFTRQDCRFFQENEYLRCGVKPCGPCEGCGDYEKEGVE